MGELGSATVQVWVRKRASDSAVRLAVFDAKEALMAQGNPPPPKPWLRDWIRGWWEGKT